jgi:hypothetical protein
VIVLGDFAMECIGETLPIAGMLNGRRCGARDAQDHR